MTGEYLNRRRFLAQSALVVGGMATGVLAAACGSASTSATATPAPKPTAAAAVESKPVAAAAPRRGGTLTWGQWDRNDSVDPATASGASALEVIGQVLDSVVALPTDQKI